MLLAVYYVRLSPFCFSRLKLTRATIALSGCRDACIGSVASQHVPHRIRDAIAGISFASILTRGAQQNVLKAPSRFSQ